MDNKAVKKEYNRLVDILDRAEVPQQQRDVLAPVMDNLSWQRVKLDETREEMKEASIVCHYSNGGGQEGERINPIFKGYLDLWRGYMLGLEKFTSYLPKDLADETTGASISILEQVKAMKQKAKA